MTSLIRHKTPAQLFLIALVMAVLACTVGATMAPPARADVPLASVATSAPTISGSLVVGYTLSASTGGWNADPSLTQSSYSYQWQSCTTFNCVGGTVANIGANIPVFTLTASEADKFIRVQVTASNNIAPDGVSISDVSGLVYAPWHGIAFTVAGAAATIIGFDATAVDATPANLVIPTTLGGATTRVIGEDAFWQEGLTGSLSIPDSVTTIANGAFADNPGITSVSFGSGPTTSQLTSIGPGAFGDDTALAGALNFPDSLVTIGTSAFYETSVTSVAFGSAQTTARLESIGHMAFYNTFISGQLLLPDSLVSVGNGAFAGIGEPTVSMASSPSASHLTTIDQTAFNFDAANTALVVPDSVVSIGGDAFTAWSHLTSVTFGSSLQTIEPSAFGDAPLTEIAFSGNVPVSIWFDAFRLSQTYAPPTALTRWQDATGWSSTYLGNGQQAPPPPQESFNVVIASPTVTSLSPASGGTGGGNQVTITGTGFATGATVTFGGTSATATVVNGRTITATVPAGSSGSATVTVTNPAVAAPLGTGVPLSGSLAAGYTYEAPSVTAPATDIVVTGSGVVVEPPAPPTEPPLTVEIRPGTSLATMNGLPITVTLEQNPSSSQLIANTSGVRLTFGSTSPGGRQLPLAPDGSLVFTPTGTVPMTGGGLLPQSIVTFFFMSTPVILGTATVNADGTYSSSAVIPTDAALGNHTIEVAGTTASGAPIALAIGVTVKTPAAALGAHPTVHVSRARTHDLGTRFAVEARGVQAPCHVRFWVKGSTAGDKAGVGGIARAHLISPRQRGRWTVTATVHGTGCEPVTVASRIRTAGR